MNERMARKKGLKRVKERDCLLWLNVKSVGLKSGRPSLHSFDISWGQRLPKSLPTTQNLQAVDVTGMAGWFFGGSSSQSHELNVVFGGQN
jgi:hypothetical protein